MLNRIRELKKEAEGAKAAGFTIIEVMIVLAIAGIIMAIVFLAIPALQKNNRNTQRKNDASRIAGLISDYVANNNGSLPGCVQVTSTSCTGLNATSEKFSIIDTSANISTTACGVTTVGTACSATAPGVDKVFYVQHADCGTGSNTATYASSARAYAIWYGIEGSTATQCLTS